MNDILIESSSQMFLVKLSSSVGSYFGHHHLIEAKALTFYK